MTACFSGNMGFIRIEHESERSTEDDKKYLNGLYDQYATLVGGHYSTAYQEAKNMHVGELERAIKNMQKSQ